MLELLFTTIVFFCSFEIIFFIPYIGHELRFIFIFVQLILCFVLFSNNYYKKHSLWKNQDYQPIHQLPYSPLVNISYKYPYDYYIYYNHIIYTKGSRHYSINQTKDFSKECFQDFFINELDECPITDIIVEDKQVDFYKNYTEVEIGHYYLYYSNNKKLGKLFIEKNLTFNLNDNLISNFKSEFNYMTVELIKKKELNKLSNPVKLLKYYSKFSDFICLTLIIFSLYFYWREPVNDNNWNKIKIANLIFEITTFALYLIRYILFIKVKKFFFENEYIYNIKENNIPELSEDYFPKLYFNIDSFPVAVSINIFIFYLIHKFFGNKNYLKEYKREEIDENEKDCVKFLCLFFLFTAYMIFFIKNEVNYFQGIKKNINEILYNWNKSPIMSIKLTNHCSDCNIYNLGNIIEKYNKKKEIYNIKEWKNNYFEIEKLNYVNYLNIYKNKDGKKCGRDSFGNYLYFPKSYECPINDIFISDNNKEIEGYEKIYLSKEKYLYYTNKNIEGQIIIDLRISTFIGPQMNLDKSNEICEEYFNLLYENNKNCTSFRKFNTVPFYKIIDKWNYNEFKDSVYIYHHYYNYSIESLNDEYLYLYAIQYQGFNSSSIEGRDKIHKYSKSFESLNKFHLFKFIISIFYIIYALAIYIFIILNENINKIYVLIVIIFLIMIIINLIWLINYIVYIELFLNKINRDFEEKKNTFLWELFILIINIFSLVFYLIFSGFTLTFCKRNNNNQNNNNRNNNINNNYDQNRNNNINNMNNNNEILAIRNNINNNGINSNNRIINQDRRNLPSIRKNINEVQQLKKIHLCLICFERETQYIFLRCFHKCICEDCFYKYKRNLKKCIFCNKPIDSIEKVYEP